MTVTAVNDAPVAVDDTVTVTEDTPFTSVVQLNANDTDLDGNALSVVAGTFTTSAGGTIVIAANGSYTYTPALNFNGTDTVNYTVTDGSLTDIGQLTLTVTAVNDAPVNTVPGIQNAIANTPLAIAGLIVNDVDGNLATVQLTVINGAVTIGNLSGATISSGTNSTSTLTLSGTETQINAALATLTYQGNLNYSGPDTLTVLSTDSAGAPLTDSDTVAITVGAQPSFSINDVSVNEGAGTITFTVTKSGATALTTTVDYAVAPNSAVTPGDYAAGTSVLTGTLSFAAGVTTQTIVLNITNDMVFELTESFDVNLSAPTNAAIADNLGVGTITDNDTPPSFAINDVNVSETAGTVTFTVTKTGATDVASSVTYAAADASALTPGDYAAGTDPLTGVLNFAAGVTTQTIVLNITNDAVAELTETFNVNLSAAVNATISDNQGVATIADDDGAPSFSINDVTVNEGAGTITFTVTKSGATTLTATVDYAVAPNSSVTPGDYAAGTSALTGTLSFASGVTTQTIVLNITDDAIFELSETFNVNLSAPTNALISDNLGVGTVTDNDVAPSFAINDVSVSEAAGTVTFTVTKTGATDVGSSVTYTAADGSAVTPGDYAAGTSPLTGVLNFAAGVTTQTIVLNITDDTVAELTETFNVDLSAAVNATISDSQGVATIADNEGAPTFAINDVTVNEGAGTITFTVTKSGATTLTTTVDYAVVPNSAVTPGDYASGASALTGTLSFASGVTTQTIVLNITNDTVFEITESFNVNLSAPTNAVIADSLGVGTIIDNDAAPNNPPIANGDTFTSSEDAPLVLNPATLTGNDADPDGDPLTITSVQGALNGTVALAGGNVVFTPAPNYSGPASFTYTISDGRGGTSTGTVNLNVLSVNDPPVAVDDAAPATLEDTPFIISVTSLLGNDADPEGDPLTISGVQSGVGGTVSLVAGVITFTPSPNFNGPASFTYTVSDGQGGFSTATVSVNVIPVNDAPVAVDDVVSSDEDQPLVLNPATLLGNDVDVDGNPLTITSVQGAVNGTVSLVNGIVVFTPLPNYFGPARFTYTVSDGQGGTSSATVNIAVLSVNDAPVTKDDVVGDTFQDTALVIQPALLLGNDTDIDGDLLAIISVQGAINGSVQLVAGAVVFTPNPGYDGPASFTYTVSDRQGGTSTSRVDLKVLGINNPPPSDSSFATVENLRPSVPGFTTVADPALYVLFTVSDINSETDLRGDRGLFLTDAATSAELTGGLRTDLTFAEGNQFGSRGLGGTRNNDKPRSIDALFVQQAVRHLPLGLEKGLFVHDAVRSSQLESMARSIRIDSFSSAAPGVSTLLHGFALGSPAPQTESQLVGVVSPTQPAQLANVLNDNSVALSDHVAHSGIAIREVPPLALLETSVPKARGAESFAAQLRRNAVGFKPRINPVASQPEVAFAVTNA